MRATKSEAENVASVVTFTAFYQGIPALSISWLSPFPSRVLTCRTHGKAICAQMHAVEPRAASSAAVAELAPRRLSPGPTFRPRCRRPVAAAIGDEGAWPRLAVSTRL